MSTPSPNPTPPELELYADVVERLRDILTNLDAATEASSAPGASWEVARLEREDLSGTWGDLADAAIRQLARLMRTYGSMELVTKALDELDAEDGVASDPHERAAQLARGARSEGLRLWTWLRLEDAVRDSDPEAWQRDVTEADDDDDDDPLLGDDPEGGDE